MVTRRRRAVVLAVALLAGVVVASVSASTSIRPSRGTPDPRAMVLASTDIRAKVTAQYYFKDADFPSVISYTRELENGTFAGTPLPYVESEAEIGTSPLSTARYLASFRHYLGTQEARKLIIKSFVEDIEPAALITNIQVREPRALGLGPGSFDLFVTARVLGRPIDFHLAAFGIERVLGVLTVVGDVGRRISPRVVRQLATIMAARTVLELVPQNTALPSISGSPAVGQTLTANPGRWTGNPASYGYRWQRCAAAGAACAVVSGATGRTYVVTDGDVGTFLRVSVTAKGTVTSGKVAVFIDTFAGTDPSASWSFIVSGSGPAISQVNGRLEATLPAGTSLGSGGYAMATAFSGCRLPGDFDMQVDYELSSGLFPRDGINLGFDVAEFSGDTYSGQHGVFVHNAGGNNHGISTNFPDPGVYRPPYNDFVPDTSRAGTLRLVRTTSGGVTRVTASRLSGASWSFTSLPYAAPTSQAISLYLFTNVAPLPGEIRVAFDNFRISSGALTCS
jgi:hypothetical protein